MRIAGLERGAQRCGRVVPTSSYRVAAFASLRIDLGGGRGVDRDRLVFAAPEKTVGIAVEFAPGTCRRALVGECEVRKDRGNVPPNASRRAFPVVARAPIDNFGELAVLRRQRDQDVVHSVTLTDARNLTARHLHQLFVYSSYNSRGQ